MEGDYAEVVAAMREPSFYPHRPATVEVHETHTSCVFIAGDRVYKLKKPLRLGFLDYSTREERHRMCREELRLNRRLSPDLYLGVRAVVRSGDRLSLGDEDDPQALEHLVEMRRFDERLTLAARLAEPGVGAGQLEEVAARIALFHASAARVRAAEDPRLPVKRANDETFTSLLDMVPASLERQVVAAERFSTAFLVARGDTIRDRAREGLVRDGHGDLRAEHVLLGDPIEIVDCIEFDPALRQIDVAADLSFLVMDLHRLGAASQARELVAAYRRHGGNPGDDGLLAWFAAQRAWVRAKVELLRAGQLEQAGQDAHGARLAASDLLSLGRRFSWLARQPLVLVLCGLSGSGKSHLAAALAQVSGLEVLNSDLVRKRLAGIAPAQPASPEAYFGAFSERTYDELGRLAAAELERNGAVLVDATFRRRADRRAFHAAAGQAGRHARYVECVAPRHVRLARVERRYEGVEHISDATPAVASSQSFDPLDEVPPERHELLRTDRGADALVAAIEAWLDAYQPGTESTPRRW